MDFSKQTLGELLSHKNETIRRNAISIYKTLIAIDKRTTLCEICGENDEIKNTTGICQNIPR
jgi:hypothetical protein